MVRFIAFEGTDGSGKTTAKQMLWEYLRDSTGTMPLNVIPQSWLNPDYAQVIVNAKHGWESYRQEEITEAYVKDKEILYKRLIVPHLPHRYVIADRYYVSDVVYHTQLFGIDATTTLAAYLHSELGAPDLWVHVRTDPDLAYERIVARNPDNVHKWEKREIIRNLYEQFDRVWSRIDQPVVVIENNGGVEELRKQMMERVIVPYFQTGTIE